VETDLNKLINSISSYKTQLKKCRYAGELCLDEDELLSFSDSVRKHQYNLIRDDYEVALLVLALNIAYYFYDDDGFWHHFKNITGLDNSESIGGVIERTLRRYKLLRIQRSGPFRYVGALLEQCGISRRYIPSFSFIVKELKRIYRGDRILDLKYEEIIRFLKDYQCPKYLKEFLLDESGATFTLQVLRILRMYEDGVISKSELSELDGFRPGFWDEILSKFSVKTNESKINFYQKPVIRLNLIERALELVFPSRQIFNGTEDKERYSYPVTKLVNMLDFQGKYNGRITLGDGQISYWEISGWKPQDATPLLFDVNKRCMLPEYNAIFPGNYYLVAADGYFVPKNNLVSLLGELKIDHNITYYIYKIVVNYGDKLSQLNVASRAETPRVHLQFRNPEDFLFPYQTGHFDVFMGALPDIVVSDFKPIENNIIGLFYDFGKVKGRIRKREELLEIKNKIVNNMPLKGRIWTETLVRNNYERVQMGSSELLFYVIPYVQVAGIDQYFGFATNPILNIKKEKNLKFKVDGTRVDGDIYKFPAKTKTIAGELEIEGDIIDFQIPLKRAGILDRNNRVVKYIEKEELLKNQYVFVGPPDITVNVQLLPDYCLTLKLNEKGLANIEGGQFNNRITEHKNLTIRPIKATIGDGSYSLGCYLIDSDVIFSNPNEFDTKDIEGAIKEILRLVALINKGPVKQTIRIKRDFPEITNKFNEKTYKFFSCAQILDETVFISGNEIIDWLESMENEPLSSILEAYRSKEWRFPLNSYKDYLPNVSRWVNLVENHIHNFSPKHQTDIIEEWSGEVNSKRVVELISSLGRQKYGNSLTQAWVSYQNERVIDALGRLNDIGDDCSETIGLLSNLLRIVIYIRQARFKQALLLINSFNKESSDISDLVILIESMVNTLNGKVPSKVQNVSREKVLIILKKLPLKHNDYNLLEGYCIYLCDGDLAKVKRKSLDWLNTWMAICILDTDILSVSEIASAIDNIIPNLPPSQEKNMVIERINKIFKRS
jgi:hypothetical protein